MRTVVLRAIKEINKAGLLDFLIKMFQEAWNKADVKVNIIAVIVTGNPLNNFTLN